MRPAATPPPPPKPRQRSRTDPTMASAAPPPAWRWQHLAALAGGNLALSFGAYFVRAADTGPVSAGFWRMGLALPFAALLALAQGQPLTGHSRKVWGAMLLAGLLFALDLAAWHWGIPRTRLGNATLFGNSGSMALMIWGLVVARRRPHPAEIAALVAALAGAAILLGRSAAVSRTTLLGDLSCLIAGLFYFGYLVLLQAARERIGSWALLVLSGLSAVPGMLVIALLLGEPVWPGHATGLIHGGWAPVVILALLSQIIGQGLLVYALGHFRPLVVGLMLLTQPAVGVITGWLAFGEALGWRDGFGMALVAMGLVLARAGAPAAQPAASASTG